MSKLRFKLETGRTHQIRAQAAHEGLPLIGDRTYHPLYHAGKNERAPVPIEFTRQALHAETLELDHPEQPGKRMTWRAPLPAECYDPSRYLDVGASNRASRVWPSSDPVLIVPASTTRWRGTGVLLRVNTTSVSRPWCK